MAERSNAAVLKTVIPSDRNRGFESLSLLQFPQKKDIMEPFNKNVIALDLKNDYFPESSLHNPTNPTGINEFKAR